MDWPLENTGLNDSDLNKVFRYSSRETTVIRLLTTDPVGIIARYRNNYTNEV
jgi:hypothetical protein